MAELSVPSHGKEAGDSESTLADEVQTAGMEGNHVAMKINSEVPPPGQILTGKQEHCETNVLHQGYKC